MIKEKLFWQWSIKASQCLVIISNRYSQNFLQILMFSRLGIYISLLKRMLINNCNMMCLSFFTHRLYAEWRNTSELLWFLVQFVNCWMCASAITLLQWRSLCICESHDVGVLWRFKCDAVRAVWICESHDVGVLWQFKCDAVRAVCMLFYWESTILYCAMIWWIVVGACQSVFQVLDPAEIWSGWILKQKKLTKLKERMYICLHILSHWPCLFEEIDA
jgi:hypothetical protein